MKCSAPTALIWPADSLYVTWRQWRIQGRWACGPMSGPIASISSAAPIAAAFFICSTVMFTTSNSAWVTTIRSQPASRAASTIASTSVGEAWPVQSTSFCWAQIFATSRTVGSALPSGPTTLMPSGASLKCLTWLSASTVGGRRGREDADLRLGRARAGAAGGQGGRARHGDLEEVAPARVDGPVSVPDGVAAAIHEAPAGETEGLHRSLLARGETGSVLGLL